MLCNTSFLIWCLISRIFIALLFLQIKDLSGCLCAVLLMNQQGGLMCSHRNMKTQKHEHRSFIFPYRLNSLYTFTPFPHPPSIFLSLCLLHSISSSLPPSLFLLRLWLIPVAVPLRAPYQTHQKDCWSCLCFSFSLYAHVCVCLCVYFRCTIHAHIILALPHIQSLLFRVCILFLSVRWKLFPWGGDPVANPSLSPQCEGQNTQIPVCTVCILMVPSICLGCCGGYLSCYACWLFSVFSSASLSRSCVYISFCRLLSCCRPQSLSLFAPASFVPPVRTHVSETQRHSRRQWGNSASLYVVVYIWLTFSGSLPLCFFLYQSVSN